MLSKVFGSALVGMDSHTVQVEVDVTKGLGGFEIVGPPDAGIRESRIRVKSAIRNSCYEFPGQRIHVNLSPADLKESSSGKRWDNRPELKRQPVAGGVYGKNAPYLGKKSQIISTSW